MQSISPLTSADFKDKSNIVIGKVEIDSDGAGNYQALPDILDFSIDTNIENQVGRLCSYSFSITVLNIDNQFYPYNARSSYYGYLKQGRRIKLYAGIKVSGNEYYYQWLIGRIDDYKLEEQAGEDICTITGRDFMRIITEFKLYSPNTYWGANETLNTVAGQVRYDLNANCKGIYIAYLDSTSPYDGSNYEEIYENQDWGYDWHNNQFCFAEQRIPDFAGTNNLKIYYMTTQIVENVVGHILYVAGIFVDIAARDAWIANADYVTPTSKTIDRVWFNTGTSALEAIRLLSEVVQYRLYFDYAGNPIFKPKASVGTTVDTIYKSDITIENIEENEEETYTHIIVTGEERDRVLGDDETAPAVPTGLALSTGMGSATQASLAWIKANWDANTEIDFGHYELRYKKNADSDYTEVSTIATSYIIYGLEPGVTYNVQVRACDVYENRSNWSSAENQATATDSTTPAQITGETATAIMAGIKIQWTAASENNIAGYIIERQESPDNVDWSGAWVEKVRTDALLWLDLLLTYSKWYKYRITAYTQTGVEGTTSAATTAVQPNEVGTNDIAAGAITANEIATDTIIANNYHELRNTYVFNGDDSLDASFPFELDFEIVSEMTAINSVKLSFRISQFRAYSKGVPSGGGHTTPSGGGHTTPSGGGHTTPSGGGATSGATGSASGGGATSGTAGGSLLTAYNSNEYLFSQVTISTLPSYFGTNDYKPFLPSGVGGTNRQGYRVGHKHMMGDHSHSTPNHTHPNHTHTTPSHTHTVSNHTHTVSSHTHTVSNHTHSLTFGIYEDSQSPTIHYHIDNGSGYGGASGNFTTDQLDIDITGSISGTGFKRIKFESTTRARIRAWVMCKIDLSA